MSSPPKSSQEGYQIESDSPPAPPKVNTSTLPLSESTSSSPILSPLSPTQNDKLAPLRALFPSTSDDILDAVLEAHNGNLQEATEVLLDMNNPEFKTDTAQQEEMEQMDLDAELARQLAEEDQLEYRQRQQQRQQQRQNQQAPAPSSPQPLTYQAYVPKRRRGTASSQQVPGSPSSDHGSWAPPTASTSAAQPQQQRRQQEEEKDELDVLAENFSKLAEQGKKSFGSFMSRMKEQVGKLDDMIQQSASPSTSEQRPQVPPKASTSYGSARTGAQWSAPEPLPRPANAPPRTSSNTLSPRAPLVRHDTNDSFTIGDDTDHSPNPSPTNTRGGGAHTPAESIDSYFKDFDSQPAPEPPIKINRNDSLPAQPVSPPVSTSEVKKEESGVKAEEAKSETLTVPGAAPKDPRKDFSKIGLLPRRSVSLLDDDKLHRSPTSSERIKSPLQHPTERAPVKQQQQKKVENSDDEEELEYQKNPFDED